MKNYLIALGILISFLSCEKDEICIDPITPHLIIRFYDATNPTVLKTVANIQIKNIDIDSIYNTNIVASDSIAIPLNVNQDSSTYVLSINSNDTALINSDTITVNYSRQAVFVSRSCGFKTVFNEATVHLTTDSDNWIKTIATVDFPENITNETKAHVKILH